MILQYRAPWRLFGGRGDMNGTPPTPLFPVEIKRLQSFNPEELCNHYSMQTKDLQMAVTTQKNKIII